MPAAAAGMHLIKHLDDFHDFLEALRVVQAVVRENCTDFSQGLVAFHSDNLPGADFQAREQHAHLLPLQDIDQDFLVSFHTITSVPF